MNKFYLYILTIGAMVILCLPSNAYGQDLERIGEEKAITINGGINLNQIFYAIEGIERRRDPYSYYLSGNLALDLYGWSIPFSFSLSNQNSSFQQPFNQYGIHPTYKWITAHLGWASMNFSPYTLNGHMFLGAGIEATPSDEWSLSGMYGRLQKAVEPDTILGNKAAYQRMGYGIKASYRKSADHIDLILFRAKDDASSISSMLWEEEVLPEENLVLSIAAGKLLFNRLNLTGELAGSAITRDSRAEESEAHQKIFGYAGKLFTPRISSAYYKAYKAGLNYQRDKYTVGLGYERVDPGYRTLGAYYFNNDLENITANAAVTLLKGKINLGINTGVQKDNLDNTKISAMRRWVGSANATYAVNEQLNLNVSYSNFQTFTHIRDQFEAISQLTPYDNLDTLNYTQISQNANMNLMYMIKTTKEKRHSLNVNASFQDATDKQGEVIQNSGTRFYNLNTAYTLAFTPSKTSVTAAFNYSQNESGFMNATAFGPTIALSRSFLERKLRSTLSGGWNSAYSNGILLNQVLNFRLMGGYTVQKMHNINLSLVSLTRSIKGEKSGSSFTEFTGTLGYSFNF